VIFVFLHQCLRSRPSLTKAFLIAVCSTLVALLVIGYPTHGQVGVREYLGVMVNSQGVFFMNGKVSWALQLGLLQTDISLSIATGVYNDRIFGLVGAASEIYFSNRNEGFFLEGGVWPFGYSWEGPFHWDVTYFGGVGWRFPLMAIATGMRQITGLWYEEWIGFRDLTLSVGIAILPNIMISPEAFTFYASISIGIIGFDPDPDELRRYNYVNTRKQLPPEIRNAILEGRLLEGMSEEQARASLGEPVMIRTLNDVKAMVFVRRVPKTVPRSVIVGFRQNQVAFHHEISSSESTANTQLERVIYAISRNLPREHIQAMIAGQLVVGMTAETATLVLGSRPSLVEIGPDWELWPAGNAVALFKEGVLQELRPVPASDSATNYVKLWAYALRNPERGSQILTALLARDVVKGMTAGEVELAWGAPSRQVKVNDALELYAYSGKQNVVIMILRGIVNDIKPVPSSYQGDTWAYTQRLAYVLQNPNLSPAIQEAILERRLVLRMSSSDIRASVGEPSLIRNLSGNRALWGISALRTVLLLENDLLIEMKNVETNDTLKSLIDRWQHILENPKLAQEIQDAILQRRLTRGLSSEQLLLIWDKPDDKRYFENKNELWGYARFRTVVWVKSDRVEDFRQAQEGETLEDLFRRWTYVIKANPPSKIRELILSGRIEIGMKDEQVIASWGKPMSKELTQTKDKTIESWLYDRKDGLYMLILENGVLTQIHFTERR
jgi:hypothetical protein